jgi:hypothetical protein
MSSEAQSIRIVRLEGRVSYLEDEVKRMLSEIKLDLADRAMADLSHFEQIQTLLAEHVQSDRNEFQEARADRQELGVALHKLDIGTAIAKAEMATTIKFWGLGMGVLLSIVIPTVTATIIGYMKG